MPLTYPVSTAINWTWLPIFQATNQYDEDIIEYIFLFYQPTGYEILEFMFRLCGGEYTIELYIFYIQQAIQSRQAWFLVDQQLALCAFCCYFIYIICTMQKFVFIYLMWTNKSYSLRESKYIYNK